MKKTIFFCLITMVTLQVSAQSNSVWQKMSTDNIDPSLKTKTTTYSENQRLFTVDVQAIRQQLVSLNNKTAGLAGVIIAFPNSDGAMEQFQVWENSNFEQALQDQNPEIRAYKGKSLVDGATINFSISPNGIQTFVSRPTLGSEFIEPYTKDNSVYVLFDSKTRTTGKMPFTCGTKDVALHNELTNNSQIMARANNQSFKTMRLALSCVGEYGAAHGGTFAGALAAMNATMTRVNGVMEKDLALHLNIITNNNLVMYYSGTGDPYSPANIGSASPGGTWNVELQNNLSLVLGNAAYDIGHLFGQSGGGGNAGCIGCVCSDDDVANQADKNKGSGYTSPSDGNSFGDTFDIDYVVHEMGHQLGANHTFSHSVESSGVNVEPGSGSTIMGYAGITNYDVQGYSDAYFTYKSIQQIQDNMAPKTCPVSTVVTNSPPVINGGADFSIPSGTAYILRGVATDADGDTLSYCWEQNDNATTAEEGANSIVSPTKARGPNYRSFTPSASPNRYMPAYSKVLAGTLTAGWESVSTVARTSATGKLKFVCTVRDNNVSVAGGGQQTNTDFVNILSQAPYNSTTNTGAGPFRLTSQNTAGVAWGAAGSSETITWDVNNTTTLVGSTNVNIKLSIDGGVTFPYDLATNTPNDGSETILVPSTPASTNCRLWIEPTANIYYAVNAAPFSIGYSLVNNCVTYNYSIPFALADAATGWTAKTINVPVAGTISDANITINATHPNLQNLSMAFTAPSRPAITLFAQQCAGNANMNVTFDSQAAAFVCASPTTGTYALPTGATLNAVNGFSQMGNWTFAFKDTVAGNTGTINSIALEVCSQTLMPLANSNFEFENFALYPNPNNGTFKVQFDAGSNSKINIVVNDMQGRKIVDKTFSNTGLFAEEIQLDAAQKGIYLVTIKDGEKQIVRKIVVE